MVLRVRHALAAAFVAAALLGAASCTRDPDVLKVQYVKSGNEYMNKKRYPEAIIEYRKAILAAPKYGEARYKLAEAYAASDDVRNALPEYVRAADILTDDVDLQLKAGNLLLLGGRFQDAKTRARVALKKEPNNFKAFVLLGNALAGLRQMDDAVNVAQRAAELEPERPGLMTNLGTLEFIKGDRDLAEAAFKKAVAIGGRNVSAPLALGTFYRTCGRLKEAEQAYKKAYDIDPADARVNRAMGSFLVEANRAPEAETYFKAAADISKDAGSKLALADYYLANARFADAERVLNTLAADKTAFGAAKTRLAIVQLSAGHRADAYKTIEEVLAKSPKDEAAHAFKARLLLADRRLDEAAAVVTQALQINPRSAQVQYMLGKVKVAQNQLEDARKAFNDALSLDPYGVDAPMELARLHMSRGEINTSISFAEQSVKNQPENLDARMTLIRSLMVRSEDYPRAEREAKALLERFPAQAVAHAAWGSICILKRDPVGARKSFERALQLNPNSVEALTGLLALEGTSNRLPEFLKRMEERAAASPTDGPILLLAAKTALYARQLDKGERFLRQAITADPGAMDAFVLLGQLYVAERRLPEATKEFLQLASLNKKSVPVATMLGLLYYTQGNKPEAQKWYEHATQINPRGSAAAANNLACMYLEGGGNLDQALQLAQAAKTILPERPEINDTLGWIYYKKEMYQEAIKALRDSVSDVPDNPIFQYHLGLAYAQMGDDAKARVALERALKVAPNFDGAADAKRVLATLVY